MIELLLAHQVFHIHKLFLLAKMQYTEVLSVHRKKVLLMNLVQNFRDAIITLSLYPGISYGVGTAVESIAEPFCIPWQNFICFSLSPNSITCTISARFSSYLGDTLYP